MCDSRKTTVLNFGGVEGDGVLGELEALLDEARELADTATLLAKDFLCVCGADDDVGNSGSDPDFDAGIAFLSELSLKELVKLGVEDTVGDEFATLGAGEMLIDDSAASK